jgi:pimeloyl-ACP methyl ester carboxylesterase
VSPAQLLRSVSKSWSISDSARYLTAVVAKQLIAAYYGQPPSESYYDGCSLGGRQGLVLAQRFPEDFDAIIAGAPALDQTGTMLSRAWWMQGLTDAPIPASKLKLLAERVYQQCDAKDGLKDGLIDDPCKCGFKPSATCRATPPPSIKAQIKPSISRTASPAVRSARSNASTRM